jgi:hypothetical protein
MSSTRLAALDELDTAALGKVQAGCNYINAEIAKARRKVGQVTLVATLLSVGLVVYLFVQTERVDLRVALFPVLVAILALGAASSRVGRRVSSGYKQIVVGRIVSALGGGLTYSPTARLAKQDFLAMDVFDSRVETFVAEDEVSGRKGAVTYTITEARASRTEGSGERKRTITIFVGSIVRIDFNKNFGGHTVVVPHGETKALGGIFGGLFGESSTRRQKEQVALENADFENQFTAYSTDQQEARYILTPKLMELIMEAQARLGAGLRLCFVENSVFVMVPHIRNRFEVSLFGPKVTPDRVVGELAEVISLAEHLIEALELETRIWSRA